MKTLRYIKIKIKNFELRIFLTNLYNSKSQKEQLLCFCILIELKYHLLDEDNYTNILKKLKFDDLIINFDNFSLKREVLLLNKCSHEKNHYSRIVTKDVFNTFIGSFAFDRKPIIDKNKIKNFGWSTTNKVVWITPKKELEKLISKTKRRDFPNSVIDYVGFSRDIGGIEYIKIDYSKNFNECVFQSNSSNANWNSEYVLFLSFKKFDYFGRTYNENGVQFGKEQVHKKSFFIDDDFKAVHLGKTTKSTLINENILLEAKKRLDI